MPASVAPQGSDEVADVGDGERSGAAGSGAVGTANAAESFANGWVLCVERMAGDAAGLGDGGNTAAKGRQGVSFAGCRQVGAYEFGSQRRRHEAVRGAAGGEVGPIGGISL